MEFTEDGESWRDIRAVYYDDNGVPCRFSETPIGIYSEDCSSIRGIKSELWAFTLALHKRVLKPTDFPEYSADYSTEGDAR
jgi:hypothetical protein